MPLLGCHGRVPLLGAIVGCHCWVPPFSAAPSSTLTTHKLVCAIWGLCWYNLFLLFYMFFGFIMIYPY